MGRKSKSTTPDFSVRDFFKRFPNDETCLKHIFDVRFGERHVCRACGVESTFHRMSDHRAWACAACGDHVYPTAGTIFQDTRTPLQVWFYAIYLFVTTRHGVSGKELQRQLGVTYKTAWRIGHKIREQMDKGEVKSLLSGHVEIDEAYVGGKRPGKRGRGAAGKTIVMGFKERGGRLVAQIIPDVKMKTLKSRDAGPGRARLGCFDRRTAFLRLTGARSLHARCGQARQEGMGRVRLPYPTASPYQFGRKLLAAVQAFGVRYACFDQPKAHESLSGRVHFSGEPPR